MRDNPYLKTFFETFDIVREIPFTHIEAFSIKFFRSLLELQIQKDKIYQPF
jgi:hypothetical protein